MKLFIFIFIPIYVMRFVTKVFPHFFIGRKRKAEEEILDEEKRKVEAEWQKNYEV